MLLLPETVARQDGVGAEMPVDTRIVQLKLGITRIIAQENLEVSVWGSPDRKQWRPLVTFPHKFYCGTYPMVLDLTPHGDVRYLRAQWRMERWSRDENAPLFGFYLSAGELRDIAANVGG
jgi:hypothetical protein